MPSLHAEFAPSSAERIILCPGSRRATVNLPNISSIYSEEGTVQHTVLDESYRLSRSPQRYIGKVFPTLVAGVQQDIVFDDEMADAVEEVLLRLAELPGVHLAEHQVDISRWTPIPDQFGTCDRAALSPGQLIIADAKFGKGVQVWAAENPQLILYALGVYDAYDWAYSFQRVELHVAQPYLDHYDVWECSIEELLQHGSRIKAAFIVATKPDAPFNPHKKACQFCRIRATCGPLAAKIHSDAALLFDDIAEEFKPAADQLDDEALAAALRTKKLYDLRFAAIEEIVMARALAGSPIAGTKLVEGRSNRRWKSDAEAVLKLQDLGLGDAHYFKKKLIGPAAAEKLLSKPMRADLQPVIVKPPGAPTLVDVSDPRPAWGAKSVEAFEDLSGSTEVEE